MTPRSRASTCACERQFEMRSVPRTRIGRGRKKEITESAPDNSQRGQIRETQKQQSEWKTSLLALKANITSITKTADEWKQGCTAWKIDKNNRLSYLYCNPKIFELPCQKSCPNSFVNSHWWRWGRDRRQCTMETWRWWVKAVLHFHPATIPDVVRNLKFVKAAGHAVTSVWFHEDAKKYYTILYLGKEAERSGE